MGWDCSKHSSISRVADADACVCCNDATFSNNGGGCAGLLLSAVGIDPTIPGAYSRVLHDDNAELGRVYFPGLDLTQFDVDAKRRIEREIEADFAEGYLGIIGLPKDSRFGVFVAYKYYANLLQKIRKLPPSTIMGQRVRIPNAIKYVLFMKCYVQHRFNLY